MDASLSYSLDSNERSVFYVEENSFNNNETESKEKHSVFTPICIALIWHALCTGVYYLNRTILN